MRLCSRLKRPVYIAKRNVTNGVSTFAPAVVYAFNYRTVRSEVKLVLKGTEYIAQVRILCTNKELENISEFDRAWLSVAPAIDEFATTAEYTVISVKKGAGGIGEILLTTLDSNG